MAKKLQVRFTALPWIFLYLKIISRREWTECFCISLSFVHDLSCDFFGGGPYIPLISAWGDPLVVSVFIYLIHRHSSAPNTAINGINVKFKNNY